MRVLVVEDDPALGNLIRKTVAMEGHAVEWVGDGESALHQVQLFAPDLILLDLSLPKLDGMDVLAEIKLQHPHTAVMIVSGRNHAQERVRCLDLGADDCVIKPFSLSELVARCRALLRRRERLRDSILRVGDLEMDRLQRRVLWADVEVSLSHKEFALLEYLLVRSGQCVSRDELLSQVWQLTDSTTSNVVDVYINYLRRKLSKAKRGEIAETLIETVRGSGYRVRLGAEQLRKPVLSKHVIRLAGTAHLTSLSPA